MTKQEQIEEVTKIVGDENVAKRLFKAGYIKADGIWKEDRIENSTLRIALNGYDTERDMKKAKRDIERTIMAISEQNIHQIVKLLSPYRAKAAKHYLYEYDTDVQQDV